MYVQNMGNGYCVSFFFVNNIKYKLIKYICDLPMGVRVSGSTVRVIEDDLYDRLYGSDSDLLNIR